MTAVDLAGESKTPPPPANPPSRPPKTPPPPTKPRKQDTDAAIFAAVDDIRRGLARPHRPSPPSKPPRKPTNTKPIRAVSENSGRDAVGAGERVSWPVSFRHGGREESPTPPRVAADLEGRAGFLIPGAVPFTLPRPPGPPRFGDGPTRPGSPAPDPPQPFPPNPFPRPKTSS